MSYLDDSLLYEIRNFFLIFEPTKVKGDNKRLIDEKAKTLRASFSVKTNQIMKWDNSTISFAYYIIKINNVVKCGIVKKNGKEEKFRP
jgi:hypothetical protein